MSAKREMVHRGSGTAKKTEIGTVPGLQRSARDTRLKLAPMREGGDP